MKIKKEGIYGFFGPNYYLSNYFKSFIDIDGITYPTVEHAFQACKTNNPNDKLYIALLGSPGLAKKKGRQVNLRSDWEDIKIKIMRDCLVKKFRHEDLRKELIESHPLYLEETNTWKDKFWGVCDNEGQNQLGKLLMDIRLEIVNGIEPQLSFFKQ